MKYKVGDRVRVRRDLKALKHYYSEDKKTCDVAVGEMLKMRGKIVTISEVLDIGKYKIKEFGWSWTDEMFEDIHNEKIVITTDGTTTTAKLYNGKEVINSAEAKCSAEDEFDFERGAGIAISRLLDWDFIVPDETPEVKPKELLKNGLFGVHNVYGWFVVVGNTFQYLNGSYSHVDSFDDDLESRIYNDRSHVKVLIDACSFNHAKELCKKNKNIVWKR